MKCLISKGIEAYIKYNYFHKEQKRKFKNNSCSVHNLFYNEEQESKKYFSINIKTKILNY
ncbi:MAG: hypothetical protein CSB55_07740 [Candidatus Cloacimonadota bacterium]|nr:MAG: hypothetical protein CSB55_07740 [Candidatus Cloacimonadota bacterium]